MAVKRNGLGKGLDSLIPNKAEKTVKAEKNPKKRKKKEKVNQEKFL